LPDHRIGISLDVRQGQAVDRLQRDFQGVASSAQRITERFRELDQASRTMTSRGWGSEQYTRQLRDQLGLVERMARLTERQARLAGNPTVQAQMSGVRNDIRQSYGDVSAVRGASSPNRNDQLREIAQMAGASAVAAIGLKGISGMYNGYNANVQQLPAFANMGKTMTRGGGDMNWAQSMLRSGQGYGYTNPEILSGAQTIQGAAGKSKDFFNQIKGVAQFGRSNGFDYGQAANYFSGSYKSGVTGGSTSQMNWQQYAVLVANTVNAGNMQGKNGQVVEALQSLTAIAQQNMVNAPDQNMLGGLYATATKGGNQALINQLPQTMAQFDQGIQSPGFGAMGQAAMFRLIAPGASYARAKIIQSQGAFGLGDNNKTNFENVMTGAEKMFGNDEDSKNLYEGQMLGIKPLMMKALREQYLNKDGTFNSTLFSKNQESLKSQLSPLDKTLQNTVNPAQAQQGLTSNVVDAGQGLNNAVFGNAVGNIGAAGLGVYSAGKIGKAALGVGRGLLTRGVVTAGAGAVAAAGAGGLTSGGVLAGGAALAGAEASTGIGIPLAIATIGGAILTAGGIWAYNKYKKSKTSQSAPSNSLTASYDEESDSGSSSGSFDSAKAATQTAAILMSLRPWANQIQGWFGGSGATPSSTNSNPVIAVPTQLGNAASMSGSRGVQLLSSKSSGSSSGGNRITGRSGGVAPTNVPSKFWDAAVAAGNATGVDPILLAAIGQHETQWGTNPNSYPGFSMGYGDYGPGPNNKEWKYGDTPGEFTNQTLSAAKQISGYMKGKPVTKDSLNDFMNNSWKPGDRKWADGVWNSYQSLGGTGGGAQVSLNVPKSINIQLLDSNGNNRGSGMIPLTVRATYNGLQTQ